MGMWIVIYAVLIGGLYFFMSRPQKKREKQLKELQASIKVGDSVVTSGGFYGKVVDTADDLYIIEFGTNKGVRIPVNKAEVFPSKEKAALDEKSN
ncbi:MAG: preprotein translocase subunit YajC [Lachnospiraceae bacterium]|nr:preprotein translocase subunit YajC [Lachnospiraceae bacterium]